MKYQAKILILQPIVTCAHTYGAICGPDAMSRLTPHSSSNSRNNSSAATREVTEAIEVESPIRQTRDRPQWRGL